MILVDSSARSPLLDLFLESGCVLSDGSKLGDGFLEQSLELGRGHLDVDSSFILDRLGAHTES